MGNYPSRLPVETGLRPGGHELNSHQPHLSCALKGIYDYLRPLISTVLPSTSPQFLFGLTNRCCCDFQEKPTQATRDCSLVKAAPAVILKSREILSLQSIQRGELLVSTDSTSLTPVGFLPVIQNQPSTQQA